ncbi:chemotaxis protein CheB [Gloeobacter violaceus]|uniref:Two-component sensor histidine kinase n=1 Tax=Gloeobacter violaceus (strain ATCC 29082 / PCC 7421) TaxID=251221 RepID=Q7NJH8_GLOVI|nr:chemotaxis protein CheB [Gloeobacter violaceus]BAC89795.1 two-component sensor histidine kinase [Gloeobacter violaceus PCC 7421]
MAIDSGGGADSFSLSLGSFAIVAVGASAGGLEAFTQFLGALPTDTGMAFVLIQHLKADQPSLLVEILDKTTGMDVVQVHNGTVVEPNHVYVIPPDRQMAITSGVLTLSQRRKTDGQFMPIDSFFHSLAADWGNRAIGVVLSGADGDGAQGLKAIKAAGGLAFAQDEQSARFPSMPHNAAATGLLDFVLPPREIAVRLAAVGRHPYIAPPAATAPPTPPGAEEARSAAIALLRAATGVDFGQYKRPTFERRLQRRMALHQIESPQEFVRHLQDHPEEVQALYRDVLISVTGFFRDPEAFEAVKNTVLSAITQQRAEGLPIRVWVPGCATGEEVYSLAIGVLEFLEEHPSPTPVQFFGTDISEEAIALARTGLYHASQIEGLSPERLRRFFSQGEGGHRVCKRVRELCVFARHDLLADPPFSQMDLVSCRNVLIYFSLPAQKRVLTTFHYSLKPDGFLLLGTSESPGGASELFNRVDSKNKLFSRKAVPARLLLEYAAGPVAADPLNPKQPAAGGAGNAPDLQKEADRLVLDRYAPVGVVVGADAEVLHFRGQTGPYLQPSPGRASLNLLKMVHPGLRSQLRSALQLAAKQSLAQCQQDIRLYDGDRERRVRIDVAPFRSASGQTHFLVLFADTPMVEVSAPLPGPRSAAADRQSAQQQRLLELQQELTAKEEYLRTAIEESEAVNQNLRVANEEILSSNEELQSTNEELQTAKEEIQSTNEELHTINDELQRRNRELDRLGNDLQNLLASTRLPIVMLDSELRIRRFTPQAGELLHFVSADVGRPVRDINHRLSVPDLPERVLEVIASRRIHIQEVQDRGGHWHELCIRPYHTLDGATEGAVLVLVDIDQSKRAVEEVKAARDYAEAIVETVGEPLIVLDAELSAVTANRAFYELFETHPDQIEGRSLFEVSGGQWNLPQLREALEGVLQGDGRVQDFEVDRDFERLGRKILLLNARHMPFYAGGPRQILLSVSDVTARRLLEGERSELLAQSEAARRDAEAANRSKDEFLATLSHELRTPLNPIIGFSQLLRRGKCDPAQTAQALEVIERCGKLQAQLIDDMLDISRIISGKLHVVMRRIDLVPVVGAAVEAVDAIGRAKSIRIETVCAPAPPVMADSTRMQQVVWNLLTNAVKFTPEGGRVGVRLEGTAAGVRLTVSDTGMGIAPEFLPKMFDRFAQGDGSRTRTQGGLGLGLYLVRSLIELHGGTVDAHSAGEGRGSVFTVALPAAPPQPEHPDRNLGS